MSDLRDVRDVARAIGLKCLSGANAGINAEAHIVGLRVIKGRERSIGVKRGTAFDSENGGANEGKAYRLARIARRANVAWDGFNVSFTTTVDGAAVYRRVDGAATLFDWVRTGRAFRNLALARSWGRYMAFNAVMGVPDRHSKNVMIVPPLGGDAPQVWSIDHEAGGEDQSGVAYRIFSLDGYSHIEAWWRANAPVNVVRPNGDGFAHDRKPYPMSRFLARAADEFRLTMRRLMSCNAFMDAAREMGMLSSDVDVNHDMIPKMLDSLARDYKASGN